MKTVCLVLFILISFCTPAQDVIRIKKHKSKMGTRVLMAKMVVRNMGSSNPHVDENYELLLQNSKVSENFEKSCVASPIGKETHDELSSLLKHLSPCECSAWKSCPDKLCPNETVCPFDLRIFEKTSLQNIPIHKNQLSFRNHDRAMPFKEMSGFCWGHAVVTQRMNTLAIFNVQESAPFPKGTMPWLAYYKTKIENIVYHNKAEGIPGFENLQELSTHPSFEDLFKELVSKSWAEQSMSLKALGDTSHSMLKPLESKKFYEELDYLIDHGVSSVIVRPGGMSKLGDSHVMIPWSKQTENGAKKYCLNDNSIRVEENLVCETYIKDVSLERDNFNFSHHSKSDLVDQAKSLQFLCLEQLKNNQKPSEPSVGRMIQTAHLAGDQKKMGEIFLKAFRHDYGNESNSALELLKAFGWKPDSSFIKENFKTYADYVSLVGKRDDTPFSKGNRYHFPIRLNPDETPAFLDAFAEGQVLSRVSIIGEIDAKNFSAFSTFLKKAASKPQSQRINSLLSDLHKIEIPSSFWKEAEDILLDKNPNLPWTFSKVIYARYLVKLMEHEKKEKFSPELQLALISNLDASLAFYGESLEASLKQTGSTFAPGVKKTIKSYNKEFKFK